MSLTTRERGAYTRVVGGDRLIFGWKNALLILGAYLRGSLYTGGGGYLRNFTVHLNTLSLVSCIKVRASQKLSVEDGMFLVKYYKA